MQPADSCQLVAGRGARQVHSSSKGAVLTLVHSCSLTKVVKHALLVPGERCVHPQISLQILPQHRDPQELIRLLGNLLLVRKKGSIVAAVSAVSSD
jgi:hypothetical protein